MASANDKEDGLWDDSALINAFNDAIFKYKKMHGQGCDTSSADSEKVITCEQNVSAAGDDIQDARRHAETSDQSEIASTTKTEIGDVVNVSTDSTQKETPCLGPEVPETYLGSSDGQHIQHETTEYLYPQSPEDYNQLLNKYYELEDQRQKILQQLNHFGSWNYSSGYGTVNSNEHAASATQAYPNVSGFFCPFGCQSWITPCISAPSCCFNEGGVRESCHTPVEVTCSKSSASLEEIDFVKTAMVATERALSSLKEQASNNSDVSINEGKEKQAEMNIGNLAKSASSGTDLSVVLNAWYSAGFYTGKYLSEQSFPKTRNG